MSPLSHLHCYPHVMLICWYLWCYLVKFVLKINIKCVDDESNYFSLSQTSKCWEGINIDVCVIFVKVSLNERI